MKHQFLKLELSSRSLNTSIYLFNKKLKKLEISQHSQVLRCDGTNYAIVYFHNVQHSMSNTYAECIQRVDKRDYHKKHGNMYAFDGAARHFIP